LSENENATTQEKRERKPQIVVEETTPGLLENVRRKGLEWRLKLNIKLNKFLSTLIAVGLYITENLDWKETKHLVRPDHYSLVCVLAAGNELSHKGFDMSKGWKTYGELAKDIEDFLEKKDESEVKN